MGLGLSWLFISSIVPMKPARPNQGSMKIRSMISMLFVIFLACIPGHGHAAYATLGSLLADAKAYADSGYPHLAIYDLEKALALAPGNPVALRTEARLLSETGAPALARQRWAELLEAAPGDTEASNALADSGGPPALVESVPKADPAPPSGLGLWISGGSRDQIREVNTYNAAAPQGQHVRYLFVESGQWVLAGGDSHWNLDLDQALMASDQLGGDAAIYLWITGSSQGAENIDPVTWERLAGELADQVEAHHFGGVHLAADCCDEPMMPLYTALRRRLKVPLSVEVGANEPAVFEVADFVVLKPVKAVGELASYDGRVRDMAALFLATAAEYGGKAMVGVSGLAAKDPELWYKDARHAVSLGLPKEGDAFLGVAVWGLVADDEGVVSDLVPDVWKQMQLPLAHP